MTQPNLVPDLLGHPWVARRLAVTPAPAAAGADHAVLVYQRLADSQGHAAARPRHERAVLYIHGRNDYFFQTWLAQTFLDAGYEFYALDLRTCGRAGIGYPRPHDVRDLRVHDEEIAQALHIIRAEHGHSQVVLNAHSTGGLQAVIWAQDHPGSVKAITLNSPWLDLNSSLFMRSYGSAFVDLVSRRHPEKIIAASKENSEEENLYGHSLHKKWGGEWDWDLHLKPVPSFPLRAGFIAGIRRLQREVKHGLTIDVPVLLCCSTHSSTPPVSREVALRSDVVLSVEQMLNCAQFLGNNVTVYQVPGGVHDLALSPLPARQIYFAALINWLAATLK